LLIADFSRKQDRVGLPARFHAGGSTIEDLATLVREAGFERADIEEIPSGRFSVFPGAGILRAYK
jgi:hypothetical protein